MPDEHSQNDSNRTGGTAPIDATGEFFSVGAPLHPVRPGYIRRNADEVLFAALSSGQNAHVIAPDRAGKTSLISATSARLQNNGIKVAVIDLAQIGERDGGSNPGRWYYSIAYRILRQLRLKVDLQNWWQDKAMLSNRQRLVEFYIEIILQNVKEQVVVFIDELQYVERLSFAGDLLASIRAAHNARTTDPELSRLCFALVCECDPACLVDDERLSPFAVSQEIYLGDFSRDELELFAAELNLSPEDAATALDRIYYWTSGHPYLSQKLARSVSREQIAGDIAGHVDRIARQQLAGRAALHSEPHMSHLHRQIMSDKKNKEKLLNLYGRIRKGIVVDFDSASPLHRRLLAAGLVAATVSGTFKIRNRAYRRVFTSRWANENLSIQWRAPAIALGVIFALIATVFAYTQLLPRPYVKAIFSQDLDLPTVYESYVNLRSFPGHSKSANRIFENVLVQRAEVTQDPAEIMEIADFARLMPSSDDIADGLVASFWDRQVIRSLREERRDDALIASLESLKVSTPVRRRLAANLVGEDYPHLIAGIATGASDRLVFNPEHMLLTFLSGPQVSQWALSNGEMRRREQWTLSALEVTPLVRRVVVDRVGKVSRIGLTVNVGHGRLDDLRLRLIAPSGRTAELDFDKASSSETDEIRFPQNALKALLGETVSGTWSLSLRDEATGVTGHLIGWDLRLDSQVVVENFDRGLDIPDPVARASDDVWLSDDGRYAIARAQQSNSARLWDLAFAQPARTIAVPASEKVLGLSAGAEYLLTASQDAINRWRIANGRRSGALEIGAVSADAILSKDGEHLFVLRQQDMQTNVELWSIGSGEKLADLGVAGDLALVAIDANGQHLAIADYDRAVRVWNFRSKELLAQIDLLAMPTAMDISANGNSLAIVHGEQGVSLWRVDQPSQPLLVESGTGNWAAEFSPSGDRVMIGNSRDGYQIHRSIDGAISGPLLDAGLKRGPGVLLSFSQDENYAVTARVGEPVRVWHVPRTEAIAGDQDMLASNVHWRESGNSIMAISPAASRIAVGDGSGHVHIFPVDAAAPLPGDEDDQLSYLGHSGPVVSVVFSNDGALVASAGFDGSVRIWDTDSGLPREFFAGSSASTIERMVFSPSGRRLAVLSGLRTWIMDTTTGARIADAQLGENHSGLAFSDDDTLYFAGDSGVLRSLTIEPSGGFSLHSVWTNAAPLQHIEVSQNSKYLILVDNTRTARVLNLQDGQVGPVSLQLPGPVSDLAFSPGELRVLFRTGRWIHRASVSYAGLIWIDAIRAPRATPGSRMVFTAVEDAGSGITDLEDLRGDRVIVLTRDAGSAKIALLDFTHSEGPTLIGNKNELLDDWRGKLMLPRRAMAEQAAE